MAGQPGYRGYRCYPWPRPALERLSELASGRSLRQTARELRRRRLVLAIVAPATLARALRRGEARS